MEEAAAAWPILSRWGAKASPPGVQPGPQGSGNALGMETNKQTNKRSLRCRWLPELSTGKGYLQVCMAHRSPRPPGKKRSQPTEQTAGRDDAPWGLGATGGQQGLGTAGRGPPAAVQQHT